MSSQILESLSLQVSPHAKDGVTESRNCVICGTGLIGKQRDYCGAACKQAAHRKSSEAHQRRLRRLRDFRAAHRLQQENTHTFRVNRYDGESGAGVPPRRDIKFFNPKAEAKG